jgi:cystathionine beta-lyase
VHRDILICSDEIHCDLIFEGRRHVPIASLDADVARRSVTLMAPSKTFNLPGLRCSFAIIPDAELRRHFAGDRDFSEINNMGLAAALAAYRDGQDWLDQALAYLQANRDFVVDYVRRELPGIEMVAPEAHTGVDGLPAERNPSSPRAFLSRARPRGAHDGAWFGFARRGFDAAQLRVPALERSPKRSRG